MPRQIQKIKQTQKIIQTHQEHTSTNPKKSYKPRNQTQKNHKRILYKTKSIHIYTQTKLSQKEKDLNPKIKSVQSLTKYPQN